VFCRHKKGMAKLVWAEVATFRTRGKEIARIVASHHYRKAFFPNMRDGGFGQEEHAQTVVRKVSRLLKGSRFIQYRVGSTVLNASHPAIRDLLDGWIYGGGAKPLKDPLQASFPKTFTSVEVEELKNCIDERASGFFTKISCTADRYLDYYTVAVQTCIDVLELENTGQLVCEQWDVWHSEIIRSVESRTTRICRNSNFELADDVIAEGLDVEVDGVPEEDGQGAEGDGSSSEEDSSEDSSGEEDGSTAGAGPIDDYVAAGDNGDV
ncbi:hypothetical protein DFH09DRAFT_1113039, partial [Mycena vulgaris]